MNGRYLFIGEGNCRVAEVYLDISVVDEQINRNIVLYQGGQYSTTSNTLWSHWVTYLAWVFGRRILKADG